MDRFYGQEKSAIMEWESIFADSVGGKRIKKNCLPLERKNLTISFPSDSKTFSAKINSYSFN